MNAKQLGLTFVLVDFLAFNVYALYQHGTVGMLELVMANTATLAVTADLLIALTLIAFWIARDAHRRGVSAFPYLIATALLGSGGPLLYLIRRTGDSRAA